MPQFPSNLELKHGSCPNCIAGKGSYIQGRGSKRLCIRTEPAKDVYAEEQACSFHPNFKHQQDPV